MDTRRDPLANLSRGDASNSKVLMATAAAVGGTGAGRSGGSRPEVSRVIRADRALGRLQRLRHDLLAHRSPIHPRPTRVRCKPCSAKRERHNSTVGSDTPTRSAMRVFASPSAASSTILARVTARCSLVPARTIACNASTSAAVTSRGGAGGAPMRRTVQHPTTNLKRITTRYTSQRDCASVKPPPSARGRLHSGDGAQARLAD
jgi:hypothetical protein